MQPTGPSDYKQLLTDVIKKQIVILGPDITLSKARNVKGLTVANDGTVTEYVGSPQEVTQALIDQFVQLSGLIVKKTMEPLLLATQPQAAPAPVAPMSQVPLQQPVEASPQPPLSTTQPTSTPSMDPSVPSMTQHPQSIPQPQASPLQPQMQQPTQPVTPVNETQEVKPAENPLAA